MPKPLVSFVIATYNRGQTLVDCLRHTLSCGLPEGQFEIIVVDNASTDGTASLLTTQLPRVTLLTSHRNLGSVAKNLGLARATGEFFVLLDDDAYPLPGAVMQMVRHFQDDPTLGAATFDITLPDGSKEASAYPDVFIGAGVGFRASVLRKTGFLPRDFFMQAEEYDLSFRILQAGYTVQRFWDMPLIHLKTPGARIGQRTTRLDVRNNLYLLAQYLPEPLCTHLAADWLSRYWMMALDRDRDTSLPPDPVEGTHKKAYLRGSAEGLAKWSKKRNNSRHLLLPETVERIFKIEQIRKGMEAALHRLSASSPRIVFADFGKNMYPFWLAAQNLPLQIIALADDSLGRPAGEREYRGIPLLTWKSLADVDFDAVIISNMSPVAAPRRTAALRRVLKRPVINLFERHVVELKKPIAAIPLTSS